MKMHKGLAGSIFLFCLWIPSSSVMEISTFCKRLRKSNTYEVIHYHQLNSSFPLNHSKQYYLISNKSILDKLSLIEKYNIIGLEIRHEINPVLFPKNYFRQFRKLRSLCLEHIHLKTIPNLLNLNELKQISLSHNDIKEILPNVFPISIQNIKLDNNQIKTIPLNIFENLRNLVELDLSTNKIEEINHGIFKILTTININLQGNPLNCDNLILDKNSNSYPCFKINNLPPQNYSNEDDDLKRHKTSESSESDESDSESSEEDDDGKNIRNKLIPTINVTVLMSRSNRLVSPVLFYISMGLIASVPFICLITAVGIVKWEKIKKERIYTSSYDQSWEIEDLIQPAEVITIPSIHLNRLHQI